MKSMKQPHEDVRGVQRDDDLLSLDEAAITHREALLAMAQHLKRACLVGNPAPIVQRMYERISRPQPGDLVVETSAVMSRRADSDTRIKGLGILVAHRDEWWETDAEWEATKAEDDSLTDDDRSVDHAWYVQYGPDAGDVCRWTNCSFTVLPIDRDTFTAPIGERDGTGITMTRDDLIGGLADSGFKLR